MKTALTYSIILLAFVSSTFAQYSGKIIYKFRSNGIEMSERSPLVMSFFGKPSKQKSQFRGNSKY